MRGMLRSGVAWLAGQLRNIQDSDSGAVCYRRGSQSCDVLATPSRPQIGVLDEATGAPVEWDGLDWLIQADDLVLDGQLTEPAQGDQIVRDSEVFDVAPPPGGKVFDWSDPYHVLLRVHTKRVEKA